MKNYYGKRKKKKYRNEQYCRYTRSGRRRFLRIPRWFRSRLLPALLVLWLADCFFPVQMAWLEEKTDAYITGPAWDYVLEPYLFVPADQYLLQPLSEKVLEPLGSHLLPPLEQYVLAPAEEYVFVPLDRFVWTPLLETVLEPFFADAGDLIEANIFAPLGLQAPWNRGRGSVGQADGTRIPAGAAPGSGDFEVHFLDVGQGLCVLVKSGEHALLYDGGGRESSSFVVAYLKQHGIEKLDYLIASHYDSDHLSGLIGVLHTTAVITVIGPDYVHDSKTYTSFQNAVTASRKTVLHPEAGSEYLLGDAFFTVLAPQKTYSDSNNNSIAIRIVNGENSFLLTGDAELESEEAMCSSGLNLYSDVICPGHHGSSNATSSLFLAYTQPTWAVISAGAGNDYGHPHEETLQRLRDAGVTVYRTDEGGTITAYSDGKQITWSTGR